MSSNPYPTTVQGEPTLAVVTETTTLAPTGNADGSVARIDAIEVEPVDVVVEDTLADTTSTTKPVSSYIPSASTISSYLPSKEQVSSTLANAATTAKNVAGQAATVAVGATRSAADTIQQSGAIPKAKELASTAASTVVSGASTAASTVASGARSATSAVAAKASAPSTSTISPTGNYSDTVVGDTIVPSPVSSTTTTATAPSAPYAAGPTSAATSRAIPAAQTAGSTAGSIAGTVAGTVSAAANLAKGAALSAKDAVASRLPSSTTATTGTTTTGTYSTFPSAEETPIYSRDTAYEVAPKTTGVIANATESVKQTAANLQQTAATTAANLQQTAAAKVGQVQQTARESVQQVREQGPVTTATNVLSKVGAAAGTLVGAVAGGVVAATHVATDVASAALGRPHEHSTLPAQERGEEKAHNIEASLQENKERAVGAVNNAATAVANSQPVVATTTATRSAYETAQANTIAASTLVADAAHVTYEKTAQTAAQARDLGVNTYNKAADTTSSGVAATKDTAASAYNKAAEIAAPAVNTTRSVAATTYNTAAGLTQSAVDTTKNAAASTYNTAAGVTQSAVDTTKNAAASTYNTAANLTQSAVDTTKNTAGATYDKAASYLPSTTKSSTAGTHPATTTTSTTTTTTTSHLGSPAGIVGPYGSSAPHQADSGLTDDSAIAAVFVPADKRTAAQQAAVDAALSKSSLPDTPSSAPTYSPTADILKDSSYASSTSTHPVTTSSVLPADLSPAELAAPPSDDTSTRSLPTSSAEERERTSDLNTSSSTTHTKSQTPSYDDQRFSNTPIAGTTRSHEGEIADLAASHPESKPSAAQVNLLPSPNPTSAAYTNTRPSETRAGDAAAHPHHVSLGEKLKTKVDKILHHGAAHTQDKHRVAPAEGSQH